jgi:hypothetical protein
LTNHKYKAGDGSVGTVAMTLLVVRIDCRAQVHKYHQMPVCWCFMATQNLTKLQILPLYNFGAN